MEIDKNWRMFSSFSNDSGPGGHEDMMRNVTQRLDVITASRVQCPLSSESRCYWDTLASSQLSCGDYNELAFYLLLIAR